MSYVLYPLGQGYDISFAVTEDHDVLSWGAKGTGATGHRLGTGAFDDDDEDLYKEPRPIRDLVGEEVCQVRKRNHGQHANSFVELTTERRRAKAKRCWRRSSLEIHT